MLLAIGIDQLLMVVSPDRIAEIADELDDGERIVAPILGAAIVASVVARKYPELLDAWPISGLVAWAAIFIGTPLRRPDRSRYEISGKVPGFRVARDGGLRNKLLLYAGVQIPRPFSAGTPILPKRSGLRYPQRA